MTDRSNSDHAPAPHNSGDSFANLPPGPKYLRKSVWAFILIEADGDVAKATAAVAAAQAQLAKELGIENTPYSVWVDTHDGGQFITSRFGVAGNSLTDWSHINYGRPRA